jgi:hypothetical protein
MLVEEATSIPYYSFVKALPTNQLQGLRNCGSLPLRAQKSMAAPSEAAIPLWLERVYRAATEGRVSSAPLL